MNIIRTLPYDSIGTFTLPITRILYLLQVDKPIMSVADGGYAVDAKRKIRRVIYLVPLMVNA